MRENEYNARVDYSSAYQHAIGTVCGAVFPENNIVKQKFKTMAEIHVEPKKQSSPAWLWILVSLIIVAAVAYFITRNNKTEENTTTETTPTSYIQDYQSADMVYCYEAA